MVLVSGLIWLIGLPLVAANYHMVTPVSLIANPLVMIPIAFALFCGLAVCCFGMICPPLANLFGWGAAKNLAVVQFIVDNTAAIEIGHWWTAGPTAIFIVLFYLLLAPLSLVEPKRRLRLMLATVMVWVSLFWLMPAKFPSSASRDSQTVCTFIDVGHGSAAWIRSASGKNILFDAGSMSSSRFAAHTISNVLWAQQIEHIHAIIVSHADLDHFNALPELIERFSIGVVYVSHPMAESRHPLVEELMLKLEAANVPVRRLSQGAIANIDKSEKIEVLLPPDSGTGGNDNSNSIVMSYRSGKNSILFPGDLEGIGMHYLLQMPELDFDLAVMPHHGSKNSRPEEFVAWCSPEHIVISASGKKTDHDVVSRIEDDVDSVFSTGVSGTIQASFDKEISLKRWHRDRWLDVAPRK